MVVGVDRDCLHRAVGGPDRVLLHQALGVRAVLDLDALARGREARGPGVVLRDVRGDGAVRPGPAVVGGDRRDAIAGGGRVGGQVLGLAHRGRQVCARVGSRGGSGLRVVADNADRGARGREPRRAGRCLQEKGLCDVMGIPF